MVSPLILTSIVTLLYIQELTFSHASGLFDNNVLMNSHRLEVLSLGTLQPYLNIDNSSGGNNDTMNGMMEMSSMMQAPRDVIIKLESNPIIPAGKESQIKLLVLDKFTQKPMAGAQIIVGIERGGAMTTMNMMGPMLQAQEQSNGTGIYVVTFTPDNNGIYTLHTHVIPPGKPMYYMMDNHIDIGVAAQVR